MAAMVSADAESGPASTSTTRVEGASVRRQASTAPADRAPTKRASPQATIRRLRAAVAVLDGELHEAGAVGVGLDVRPRQVGVLVAATDSCADAVDGGRARLGSRPFAREERDNVVELLRVRREVLDAA